jgi:hypothetical protein
MKRSQSCGERRAILEFLASLPARSDLFLLFSQIFDFYTSVHTIRNGDKWHYQMKRPQSCGECRAILECLASLPVRVLTCFCSSGR